MSDPLRIGYSGFGVDLPSHVISNRDLESVVDTSDEWIQKRTGICNRRVMGADDNMLDMAVRAARRALDDAGVDAAEIGDIRVGVNSWMRFPSLASQLQHALGCIDASASDVAAGCSGFIYAVEQAYNRIFVERVRRGRPLKALVLGVDCITHLADWTDRTTCVLFGDGAGAVVMEEVDEGAILQIHTHSQGQYGDLLSSTEIVQNPFSLNGDRRFAHDGELLRPYLRMNGPKVYGRAIESMVREVLTVVEEYNQHAAEPLALTDIDYVYPHQANLRIIERVAEKLGFPLDRVYTHGIREYGNTSAASIPLGYGDNRAVTKAGRYEVDVAFGAGFASGAILRETRAPTSVKADPLATS